MKNPKLRGFGLIAATVLTVGAPHASAQDTPIRAVPQDATRAEQWQVIKLRNVSANFMAYWLDAQHHPVIEPRQGAKPTWAIGKTDAEVKAMFSLPAGVQAIAPVDPQNALWVLGTPEGVQKLVEKVELLDKPLRQVEIEAQVVQISAADAKALGIAFTQGEGKIEVGMAGANVQEQIKALIEQKRAKILTAPRVTAIFGAKSTLSSMNTTTVVVAIKNENGRLQIRDFSKKDRPEDQLAIGISTSIQLSVTPTLNSDNTISLQMGPMRTLGLTGVTSGSPSVVGSDMPILLKNLDNIASNPIVLKDGQTAALQGLTWSWSLYDSKTPSMNVMVLVTAKVIHRAGEDEVRTAALPR